ncbi:hypothetical protein ACE1AT_16900 [Pelatocladus sp. BLCC-F211]|uniref:hypothetical protein n=1 Tax=Pelatocladus sp. BLCC-F211 TaxID=3342752 RepID=UPI0035B7FCB7
MIGTNWRGFRVIAWVGQALLTIFVIVAALQGNWLNALALACFLVVSLVFVIKDDRLPTLFDFLFVVAALLNAAGWVWGLFYMPGPYDEIVHAYTTRTYATGTKRGRADRANTSEHDLCGGSVGDLRFKAF